jgi:hypothetical protein
VRPLPPKHVVDLAVVSMSRPREQVIPASDDNARMNAKHRRLLQTLSVVALLAYTALLAYPTLSRGAVDDEVKKMFLKKPSRRSCRPLIGIHAATPVTTC